MCDAHRLLASHTGFLMASYVQPPSSFSMPPYGEGCPEDITMDGIVNTPDLLALFAGRGPCL